MKKGLLLRLAFVTLFTFPIFCLGQTPNLGTATNFALFTANGAFTNVGSTTVTGDIGTNVGAFSGFPPGMVNGQTRLPGSTQADQAATDVTAAYNSLTAAPCGTTIGPLLGNGQTITSGVYCQSAPAAASTLNGTLVLDGPGIFIIKLNGALTTTAGSSISLINGASWDNVYFQVNGAVDVGVGSHFKGIILANGAISLLTGASLEGRGLSIAGAISLSNNTVTTVSPALAVAVTPGTCSSANNAYSLAGTVSLTAAVASVITITDGTTSTTVAVVAGQPSATFSLSSLMSGTGVHTVTASASGYTPASTSYAAPASCTVAVVLATLGGSVYADNNKNGVQDGGDTPLTGVTVTLLNSSNAPISSTTTSPAGLYNFTGLTPGTPYSVSISTPANYSTTNAGGITGPITLTAGQNNATLSAGYYPLAPTLTVSVLVDKSTVKIGDLLTYTLVLTNAGTSPATNVVVNDSTSVGLTYVANSAVVPTGTTFQPGTPVSSWTVPTINGGQSFSLTFQARADSAGILYNTAIIPGDTVKVCTSIPAKLCPGDQYILSVPAGRASYRWYKDGVLIAGQTTNELIVTAPGSYSLGIDNAGSQCPDFSCCPFIVEADSLPAFQAVATTATCLNNTPQANGQLALTNFNAGYTYQYSLGASFNQAASLSGVGKPIPANGVIAATLPNPVTAQPYTVRVFNSSGCYTDVTVMLVPTVCECPVLSCVPVIVQRTKRAVR